MAANSAGATMKYVPNIPAIEAYSVVVGTAGVELLTGMIVDEAKATAPVLTGAYRNSLEKRVVGLDGIVFSDIEYAPYLEFGTSDTPTFATLRRASEDVSL
jgi:hypothetical protein